MRRTYTAWVVFSGAATAGCLSDLSYEHSYGRGRVPEVVDARTATSTPPPLALGPTLTQPDPPPPLSGGTLAVIDEREAIAADPDRDLLYVVDHLDWKLLATIPLERHDEPGRVAIDLEGRRAFVALRRGGAVVAIDLTTRKIASRVRVCPAPRGVAWDATTSSVLVVCAGGEMVTVDTTFTSVTSGVIGLPDLRDVVVTREGPIVSTFRTAQLARVDASGVTTALPLPRLPTGTRRVAWRTFAAAPPPRSEDPEIVVVSQQSGDRIVDQPAEYYGSAPDIGPGTVVHVGGDDVVISAVLPIDAAATEHEITVVAAADRVTPLVHLGRTGRGRVYWSGTSSVIDTQITSVAYAGERLLALTREPAALLEVVRKGTSSFVARELPLSAVSRRDTGHDIFHIDSGRGIACASCHPEGRDDGNSWRSVELGPRRTPSLVGTVASTAPYHWNGEAADMRALANLTFTSRMRGPSLDDDQTYALDHWLTRLPPLAASPASDAAARGRALFDSERGKCSGCHTGPARTNNQTVDVGTGGLFQVPSLVNASFRAPYLHDGTVGSIDELVAHGHGANVLTPSEAADVAAYVRTF